MPFDPAGYNPAPEARAQHTPEIIKQVARLIDFWPFQRQDKNWGGEKSPLWDLYHRTDMARIKGALKRAQEISKVFAAAPAMAAERDRLREALETYSSLALKAYQLIDRDKEMTAMKLLKAMAGGLPGYRDDIDEVQAALAAARGEGS